MRRSLLPILLICFVTVGVQAQQINWVQDIDSYISYQVGSRWAETAPLQSDLIKAEFSQKLKRNALQSSAMKAAADHPAFGANIKYYNTQNTGDNGLSSPWVRFVRQGMNGDLYFSGHGVDIFNGFSWENASPLNSEMPAMTVYDMLEDTKGNLWFATFSGLAHYDRATGSTMVYTPDNSDIRSPMVYTLFQDSHGRIYAGHRWDETYQGGATIFDENGTVIANIHSSEDGLYGDSIEDIVEDGDGNIWLATGADPETGLYGGINVYVNDGDTVTTFYNKDNSDLPTNEVSSLAVDDNGNLWAGLYLNASLGNTEGGLVMFDGSAWTYYNKTNGDQIGNLVMSLEVDSNGNLWIGADDGAYLYNGTSLVQVTGGEDDGYALKNVGDVKELADGRIAFSKFLFDGGQGGGASFHDPATGSWEHLSTRDGGLNASAIFGAAYDSQGNLWATGFYGLMKFDGEKWELWTEKDGLNYTYGWDLIVDSNDNLWVNSTENGLTRINADGTIDKINEGVFVESNWEARNGDLWFGDYFSGPDGVSNGMLKYDGTTYTVFDSTDGLPKTAITSIAEDASGRILAATGDGLYRLDGSTFSKWEFDGYGGGGVPKVHLDSNDRLWIVYGGEVHMLDGTTWSHFGIMDGISNGWIEDIEHDASGRVWFAQPDGALVYDGGEFHRISPSSGFPTQGVGYSNANSYDLAPHPTDASTMAFALWRAGIAILDTEMPLEITSLMDNPDDQGGWIRLKVDGYLLSSQYTGDGADVWRAEIMMDGHWEAAAPVAPASSKSISVQVPVTKPSGVAADETNSFDFRVVALDDDGTVVGISEHVNGFAEDNIAPAKVAAVTGSISGSEISLDWNSVTDNDLKHYAVFSSSVTDFTSEEPIAVTNSTSITVENDEYISVIVVAVDNHNNFGPASDPFVITSAEVEDGITKFALDQNYPNPFNPSTQISYSLPQNAKVTLNVYNSLGQMVKVLVNEVQGAGSHEVTFNASDLPSGMYIYRLQAGSFVMTKKMTLLK